MSKGKSGFNSNTPYFIYEDKNGNEKVKGSLLAKFVRDHLHYKLVRSGGRSDLQIFVYENGVYRLCAAETFKGLIKRYIADYDESLVTMFSVNETYGQLITDLELIQIDDLNNDESIINFKNGILKVTADELFLSPHTAFCRMIFSDT